MMNWKIYGKEVVMAHFKVLSRYSLGSTEEIYQNLSQGIGGPAEI
jgi:hypothetical protein